MHKFFLIFVLLITEIIPALAWDRRDFQFYKEYGRLDTTFFYTSMKLAKNSTPKTSDPYLLENCGKIVNDSVINGIKITGQFYFMKYEEKQYCADLIYRADVQLRLSDSIIDDLISKKYHVLGINNLSRLYDIYSKLGNEALDKEDYHVSLVNFLLAAWYTDDRESRGLAIYNVAYANYLYQKKNNEGLVDTEEYLKLSLNYLPDYSKSCNLLGAVLEDRGSSTDILNASEMYRKAVELDSTNYVALYNRARLYPQGLLFKNVYQEAIEMVSKAIYYSPVFPDYYFLRGRYRLMLADFFKEQENFDGAIDDFEKVIQLGGDVANAYVNLSRIYQIKYEKSDKTDYKLRDKQIEYIRKAKAMGNSYADTLAIKYDFDFPDYDNVNLTRKNDFEFGGWKIIEERSGDLNGDGHDDLVLLLRLDDDSRILMGEKGQIDNRPRILVIAFYNSKKSRFEVSNLTERFLINPLFQSTVSDRFKGIEINGDSLNIVFGENFSDIDILYTYTFKFKNNIFFLTNIREFGTYKKTQKEKKISLNMETNKAYLKREDNEILLDFKTKHDFRLEDMKPFRTLVAGDYAEFLNITDEELAKFGIRK